MFISLGIQEHTLDNNIIISTFTLLLIILPESPESSYFATIYFLSGGRLLCFCSCVAFAHILGGRTHQAASHAQPSPQQAKGKYVASSTTVPERLSYSTDGVRTQHMCDGRDGSDGTEDTNKNNCRGVRRRGLYFSCA